MQRTIPVGAGVLLAVAVLAPWFATSSTAAAGGWLTFQRDNARSGVDSDQPPITGAAFDWSVTLDALIYAQPLVVGNTVIAATEGNSVYSIDATTHVIHWQTRLGQPATQGLIPGCGHPQGTGLDPVGITSTPVVDPATNTVYAVGLTQLGSTLQYVLAALDLSTGLPRYQVPINPTNAPGLPTFVPGNQDQRSALSLSQGRVYVSFGGLNGDCGEYRGWVWSANAADGAGPQTYEVPAVASGAAVWAPGGAAVDGSGNVYVSTGNSDHFSGSPDHSESVIRLSPQLQEAGFFTPTDWAALNTADADLGSFGPLPLDNAQFSQYNGLLFQAGKGGRGYLLRASSLGGLGGELFSAPLCAAQVHGGAAYVPPTIYIACRDSVLAVRLSTSGGPSFTVTTVRSGYQGGNPSAASTPIWSGGRLWNVDIFGARLIMMDPATGNQQAFPLSTGADPVNLSSLSSGASHIFVPGGTHLDAFLLTSASQPTPTPTSTATPTRTPTSTPLASTATPTATSTPLASTATPTRTATPTPTSTPISGGTFTIAFDDLPSPNRPLTGQYPAGVLDWGSDSNAWYLSGPYDHFSSNSLSLGPTPTRASFTLLQPRVVVQFDADNGGSTATSLTLSCSGLPNVPASLLPGEVRTIRTNWSTPCATVTFSSSNGWFTNVDNLVVSSTAAATPTPMPTPTATPSPTATATATPTRTPTPSAAAQTITFDDLSNPDRVLTGAYPAGVADWGPGNWYLSRPWQRFTTNSVSFNGPNLTSEAVTLATGRHLERIDAYNGGTSPATLTITCAGQSTVSATLAADQIVQVATGWTTACSAVTLATTNGWYTNFDNLVVR